MKTISDSIKYSREVEKKNFEDCFPGFKYEDLNLAANQLRNGCVKYFINDIVFEYNLNTNIWNKL